MSDDTTDLRFAGTVGFWAALALAVILGVHPFGSTDLYDDPERFLDHVDDFWIAIHLVGALLLTTFPVVIARWARELADARARFVGRWATIMATLGMAVGVIHLVVTDTMQFRFFRDTWEANESSEAAAITVDLMLRWHASTLTAWVLSFFMAVPLLLGWACLLDGRTPRWFGWLAVGAGALQIPAVVITLVEEQWTTLSEQVIFRTGVTLFLVWFLLQTWAMRKGSVERVPTRTPVAA